jgi:hypothetical protein
VATAVATLVERPCRVRTLFSAFRRAGWGGRVAAAVLAPGWASGLVFLAVVAAACVAGWLGFVTRFLPADERPVAIALAALAAAAIVCPLPVIVLCSRVRYPLLLYGLVQLLCFSAFVFANAFRRYDMPWADYAMGRLVTLPFPLAAGCALVATNTVAVMQNIAPTFTTAALAVISVVLAVVARPWLRELAAGGRLVRGEAVAAARRAVVVPARRAPAVRPWTWTWRGDDFPGWLSPMLVRELRQGVQSGIFAWTFIGIQGAMFALMTWAVGTFGGAPEGASGRDFQAMFWGALALAIVVVVPLRGLTAVSGERVASNLDLVRLTRLSATRIVLGKWAALVGQGLLVATALLPYLALRYFFGGVNVVVDLELFGWMVAGSMTVAAAALALFTLPLWGPGSEASWRSESWASCPRSRSWSRSSAAGSRSRRSAQAAGWGSWRASWSRPWRCSNTPPPGSPRRRRTMRVGCGSSPWDWPPPGPWSASSARRRRSSSRSSPRGR